MPHGGVDVPVAEVRLDVAELGGGHVVDEVEVARRQVGVGGVVVGEDLEVDAAVLRLVVARVVVPLAQVHRGALGVRLDGVRAVPDGLGEPGVVVVVERLGQGDEGGVAEGVGPQGELLGELGGEAQVVDDLQAGQGLGGGGAGLRVDLVVALDVLEEVGVLLVVLQCGAVVPRVDEGVGGDLLAVGERPAVLEFDREVLGVRRVDGLGDHVLGLAGLRVVADQSAEDHVEDLAALDLVGVGGFQWVLRVSPGGADDAVGAAAAAVAVTAAAGRRCQGDGHRTCGPPDLCGSAHEVPPRVIE